MSGIAINDIKMGEGDLEKNENKCLVECPNQLWPSVYAGNLIKYFQGNITVHADQRNMEQNDLQVLKRELCLGEQNSLHNRRLRNKGRAVLGTRKARGVHARGKLALPYSYTVCPKLHKRLLRRLRRA